jgi:hypothetical protein
MPGSAFVEGRVLLVEQPGPWGHSGLAESHFDHDVAAELLRRAAKSGLRVLAIRQPGRTPPEQLRRWMVADCRAPLRMVVGGTFDDDAELLALDLDAISGDPIDGPLYFVCAHSKRDLCCAVRGRAVAAALAVERPGQVWECSHTGGHRFAANVLVLPSGVLYGRAETVDVTEFVAVAEQGVVLPDLLRGRLGYQPAVQAAMAYAYAELGISYLDDLELAGLAMIGDRQADVRLTTPSGVVSVTVNWETVDVRGLSCAKPGPDTIVAYRPLSLRAVSSAVR